MNRRCHQVSEWAEGGGHSLGSLCGHQLRRTVSDIEEGELSGKQGANKMT